jgi:hypothetical protein
MAIALSVIFSTATQAAEKTPSPPPPTDFSDCQYTDGDVAFFAALKKDTSKEAASALQGQSCGSRPAEAEAFKQGFADAFEARKYLPTFGRYKVHYTTMMRIEESQRACLEKDAKSPEARACCMQGYALGEAAFKKRLKSSEVIPNQCAEEFAQGTRDGRNQCDPDCAEHPFPESFECHAICYSFGWNESFAPCLAKTFADELAPQARRNRSIQFFPAYEPAKAESNSPKKSGIPANAGTAR